MSATKAVIATVLLTTFSLAACAHKREEGPAEKAGAKIDQGLSKMGEKMEDAGQKMQDKAKGD